MTALLRAHDVATEQRTTLQNAPLLRTNPGVKELAPRSFGLPELLRVRQRSEARLSSATVEVAF